jgi:hypothetical protein
MSRDGSLTLLLTLEMLVTEELDYIVNLDLYPLYMWFLENPR